MPQNDSPAETSQPAPDDRAAIKAMAEAEERRAAELIAQVKAEQDEPEPAPPQVEEESLVSILAQGPDYLHQKMREHTAKAEAKKNAYKPPPMTERQRTHLEEEQAAGRRARERHEQELASRPSPPRDPSEGTTNPVQRPGGAVPDPILDRGAFVAGRGQFDSDDRNAVMIPGQ